MSDSRLTRPGETGGATRKTYPPSDHEAITKAARGVPDRTASTLTFVAGTRTFTITPVNGAFSYYIHGRRYTKPAAESIVIADTSGTHWIYYDGATLSEIIDPDHETADDLIFNKVRVGLIYWNATDGADPVSGDERHGTVMSGASQEWKHDLFGMVWHTGLDISGYTLDTDSDAGVSFELTDGIVHDEDLEHDIEDGNPANHYEQQLSGGNAAVPILYRDDVDGSWTEDAATDLPWKLIGAGQRLAYNNDDGDNTFSQIEIAANKFVNAFLYATNDWKYPVKMIQGQNEHASNQAAVEAASSEIVTLGDLPSPEMVLLYAFSLQTNDPFGGTNNCKIVAVTDFRQLSRSGGLVAPPQPHAILSTTHSDADPAAVVRGDIQIGNATPAWARLGKGAAATYLRSDGTDPSYSELAVVDDPTPQLGGQLDAQAHSIGFTLQTATGTDGTTTIDWRLGNKFRFTFGAFNETFTFTAPSKPGHLTLWLIQDGVGGRTMILPGTVKKPGGVQPALSSGAGDIDIIALEYDGTNYYLLGIRRNYL